MKLLKPFIALTIATASIGAFAQWQWIDKDGRKIFSDRGPGPEVPEKNILKKPAGSKQTEIPSAQVEPVPASPQVPKDSGVDKNLEAKKKQAEAAETAKRKVEEERIAKAKAENCKLARQAKTTFDSGVRVARTNQAGEREFLDDAARAAETQRIQGVIDADCK
ncbi:Domain of unknown function DUF4124 [Comamonadaceae bacterium]